MGCLETIPREGKNLWGNLELSGELLTSTELRNAHGVLKP